MKKKMSMTMETAILCGGEIKSNRLGVVEIFSASYIIFRI